MQCFQIRAGRSFESLKKPEILKSTLHFAIVVFNSEMALAFVVILTSEGLSVQKF